MYINVNAANFREKDSHTRTPDSLAPIPTLDFLKFLDVRSVVSY